MISRISSGRPARGAGRRPGPRRSGLLPLCGAGVLCVLAATSAQAHRLEPINTEYAQPFEPGVGVLKLTLGHSELDAEREDEVGAGVEYGLLHRLQFSIDEAYSIRNGAGRRQRTGFVNPELGLRYLVAGGNGHDYALSVNPSYTPVFGSRQVREGVSHYGFAINGDYYGKAGWLFFSNVGFEQASRADAGASRERHLTYRLAAVQLQKRWCPTVELLGDQDLASGRHDLTLVPEIQYYRNQWMELKLGVPVKLTHGSGRLGVQFQVTFALGKGSHG